MTKPLASLLPNISQPNPTSPAGEPSAGKNSDGTTGTPTTPSGPSVTTGPDAKGLVAVRLTGLQPGTYGAAKKGRNAEEARGLVDAAWTTLLTVRRSWKPSSENLDLIPEEAEALLTVEANLSALMNPASASPSSMSALLQATQMFLAAFPFGANLTDTSRNNLLLWNWVDAMQSYPLWAVQGVLTKARNTIERPQPLVAEILRMLDDVVGFDRHRLSMTQQIIRAGRVWPSREAYHAHLKADRERMATEARQRTVLPGNFAETFAASQEKRRQEIAQEEAERIAKKQKLAETEKRRHDLIQAKLRRFEEHMTRAVRYGELWAEMDALLTAEVESWAQIQREIEDELQQERVI